MIHRLYLVKMPSLAGTMPYLDIVLQGPVGSPAAPVTRAQVPQPVNTTAGPVGWQVFPGSVDGDGQFCEWRSRPERFPVTFQPGQTLAQAQANGFVPRFRLGWNMGVNPAAAGDGCVAAPSILYSQTLVGQLAAPFAGMVIADPTYGPVLRLLNTPDTQGGSFVINLDICEAKDEDRDPNTGA